MQDQLTKANRDQQLGLPVAFERQSLEHFLTRWLKDTGIRVTMDLYSHVAPVLQRDAANQMDALLRGAKAAQK